MLTEVTLDVPMENSTVIDTDADRRTWLAYREQVRAMKARGIGIEYDLRD